MCSLKKHWLLCLLFTSLANVAWAQLPIRNTRWQGTLAGDVQVRLVFRNDTLLVTTQPDNVVLETMLYRQTSDTLYLQKITGQSPCGSDIKGLFRLSYDKNGETVKWQLISDDCPERRMALSSSPIFTRIRPNQNQPPRNWPYLDPKADSVAGISLYRAYDLLKGKVSVPVVVGVLDSGVDLTHEDLRDVAWVNSKEKPGNDIDDDKNGYTDDTNGWNFMGAKDGTTYEYDQPEITQTYVLLKSKYDNANSAKLNATEKRQYDTYQQAKRQFLQHFKADWPKHVALSDTVKFWQTAKQISSQLPDTVTSQGAIRNVKLETDSVTAAVQTILADAYLAQYGSFDRYIQLVRLNWARFRQIMGSEADIAYNPYYNPRKAVGDDPANPNERYYGSPRMLLGDSEQLAVHGSHVAGIIAAKRGNGLGIDGVADNVRIMPVSVVPSNGDERDKDVANGIRYAVDNGAKVINMSFGKRLSPFKEQVDAAIRYAEEHDVLIVHSSGNNGENSDSVASYPSARYEGGKLAQNILVVGNNTWRLNETLPSRSSNYGIQMVDVFAPGTDILSTLPRNRYASFSGTSMSSPMTAGVAALLRSYFPRLTAVQVKNILIKSAYRPNIQVRKPGRAGQKVNFTELSRSGGIVNAYEAVKLILSETGFK
ncbi:S8 family peptidase [Spirosoma daeguense]